MKHLTKSCELEHEHVQKVICYYKGNHNTMTMKMSRWRLSGYFYIINMKYFLVLVSFSSFSVVNFSNKYHSITRLIMFLFAARSNKADKLLVGYYRLAIFFILAFFENSPALAFIWICSPVLKLSVFKYCDSHVSLFDPLSFHLRCLL